MMIRQTIFTITFGALLSMLGLVAMPTLPVAASSHLPAECAGDPNTSAFCQTCDQLHLVDKNACDTSETTFSKTFEALVEALIYVIGAVAIVAVVLGGGMYVFSQGEAANIKRAKDIITYAVVGLVVAIVARAAVFFVIGRI